MLESLAAIDSPLRLVRSGLLTLGMDRTILSADEDATALFHNNGFDGFQARVLEEVIQPVSANDVSRICGPLPFTYIGMIPKSSARVLVHASRLHTGPEDGDGVLVASVTSVNEYLAESAALANVQFRTTIESIIAGFAHEVRNPLAAILSLTEAALQQDPAIDTVLVRIPSLVDRIEGLIKQSLAYSRPKPPQRALHRASYLLDHALSLVRPKTQREEVRLEVDAGPNEYSVFVDLAQCEQILVNLTENALDAAKHSVKVTIRDGQTTVPSTCIEVLDDGDGVPTDIAKRIFDPFFTTKANGTGLGLAIARDLARLNGGDVQLLPTGKKGCRFRLSLPATAQVLRGLHEGPGESHAPRPAHR